MVQLSPLVATPKTPKMVKSKTAKKSGAVVTPAKPEMKMPKQAKNTPVKAVLQAPEIRSEVLVKEKKNTPKVAALQTPKLKKKVLVKQAKNAPKASAQTCKNGTVSAKKNKVKAPKPVTPSEDVEMKSEREEEEPLAELSPKKEAVIKSNYSEMSAEEEEIEGKPKSSKSFAHEKKENSKKICDKFALFVSELNYNTSENAVLQHFSQFGTVTKCAVPRSSQNKSINKGYGFIEFASQAALDKAATTVHALDCRTLKVRVDDAEFARKRKSDDFNQPGGDYKRQMTNFDNELFVARLSFSCSKDTIKEHFSQFGEVISVRLPLHPNTSQNRGFAFVAFKEASALQKAMADTYHKIDSAEIVIMPKKNAVVKETFPKPSHPNELFVGGLETSTQKHILEHHFSKYGKVNNVTLPWNNLIGRNKGFGFVCFESATSLENALEEDHEVTA